MSSMFELSAEEIKAEATHYVKVMMGVSWAEAGLGIAVIIFQTVTGLKYTKRFRLDYWLCLLTFIVAMVGQIILTYTSHLSTKYGNTLELSVFQAGLHWGWIATLLSLLAACCGKLAIIAFLSEVRGHHKTKPWSLYFIGLTNVLVTVATIALLLTACTPTRKLWDFTIPGSCPGSKRGQDFAYFGGVWSAVSDFFLALYPIYIVWNLHMHLRMKIGLCALMGFGIIAGACAIIRTTMLHVLSNTAAISFGVLPLTVSAVTEQWVTMIVASIPPSRPVMMFFVNKLRDATYKTKTIIIRPGAYYHGEKLDGALPSPPEAAMMKPYKPTGMFSHAYHSDSLKNYGGGRDGRGSAMKHRSVGDRYAHDYSDIGTLVRAGTRGIFMTTDVVVEYEEDERDPSQERRPRANSDDTQATMFDRV